MSRRTERVGSLIRDTIGPLLLAKLSDPRVEPARTSITRVEVPEDLLTAKVYVSVIGTDGQQRRTLQALRHAAGYLQELMMEQIELRNTPRLEFVLDVKFKKTLETYQIIQRAMDEIRQKEQAGRPQESPAPQEQAGGDEEPQ